MYSFASLRCHHILVRVHSQVHITASSTFAANDKMGCLHMGNLYETIHALCVRDGVTDSRMCTDIGISRGIMSDLKTGRKSGLSSKTLNKIADYFGVSMSYLLGTEKAATHSGSGHSPISESIADFIDTLPASEQGNAWNLVRAVFGGKAAD